MSGKKNTTGLLLAGFYNGLQKLSVPIFGVITTMILAHKALTKTEMGVWSLFLVITSFIELIRQALVKTSLIKYINHSSANEHKYVLSAALLLNTIVTLILLLCLGIFASDISSFLEAPLLETMIYIFSFGMLFLIPFSHFEWIMYSNSHFSGLFKTFLFRQGISLLLILIFLIFNERISLNYLVIFYCFGILGGVFIGFHILQKKMNFKFVFSYEWLNRMWHFSKFVFGSGLSTLVFANASQILLSPLLGSVSFTASQSIALRIINIADMPSQVLSDMLFPKTARKEISENRFLIKYYYEKTVGATLCFTIPILLFILTFPKLIIFILAGSQYFDAIIYLQIISISGIFLAFLKQFGVIFDSIGKPKINFFIITIIACVHVVLTFLFINKFGFIGAAYALVISHVFGFVITQILLFKYFGIKFISCFISAWFFFPELIRMILDKSQWKK